MFVPIAERKFNWSIFDVTTGDCVAESRAFVADPSLAQIAAEIAVKQRWFFQQDSLSHELTEQDS